MMPRGFADMNCVYRDPEEFSGVAFVPAMRDDETETVATVWQPNDFDLAKLNAGASIVLFCEGEQAPVRLAVMENV
jgi:hypothetical protein